MSLKSRVISSIPIKFKTWLKLLFVRQETVVSCSEESDEELCSTKTYYPGLGEFEIPFAYKYFDWYYPTCELNSKRWVFDHVKTDWTIIDCGANVGVYTLLFGTLAKSGNVLSLEPTDTFDLLKKNVEFHHLKNVKEFKCGLSDTTGVISENIYKIWGKSPESSTYSFTTLDNFVDSLDLAALDLVKIDTDGFELEILNGASLTLERFNPWLMIEFSYALNTRGYEVGHLLEKLVELGYRKALLLDGNNLVLKKSSEILENWSTTLSITPHEYAKSQLSEVLGTMFPENLVGRIKPIYVDQFIKDFFSLDSHLNEAVFPRLPNRGPKMEVNDAPVLAKIYRAMNSENHLEFGTWEGFGVALFCSNSKGKVTTINLPLGEVKQSETLQAAYSSSLYPARRKRFTGVDVSAQSDSGVSIGWIYKQLGFQTRVRQILKNSLDLTPSDFPEKFQSILVDGAHDYESVVHDSKLALEVLSDDGIIIWHDFVPFQHEREEYSSTIGVFEAINALAEDFIGSGITLYWLVDTWLLVGKRNP